MRRTDRFLVPWVVLLLFVALPAPGPAPADLPGGVRTVEPTLPLTIDLLIAPGASGADAPAELQVELLAGPAIEDLSLALDLPDGITAAGDDARLRGRQPGLVPGERRSLALPLQSRPGASREVRLHASFRLTDGRTFSVMQGATFPGPPPGGRGRRHAGAYEVYGVPLSDLRR